MVSGTLLSEFRYEHNVPSGHITSWSQQAGTPHRLVYRLEYDNGDQLLSALVSEGGTEVQNINYTYDPAGNRLTKQVDATTRRFSYNSLNELTTVDSGTGIAATYQWDAEQRLVSASAGHKSILFTHDGIGRLKALSLLENGLEVSNRQFIWCDNEICEERAPDGTVSKRFFSQGMKLETGLNAGDYFYTRDHLGSVRELTDSAGNVRARYAYDPFGQRTKPVGDLEADFGFAGMLWISEAGLYLTTFRTYDPNLGRWLSRDPLSNAEVEEGYNLYCYVHNNPVNFIDPLGLGLSCCGQELKDALKARAWLNLVNEGASLAVVGLGLMTIGTLGAAWFDLLVLAIIFEAFTGGSSVSVAAVLLATFTSPGYWNLWKSALEADKKLVECLTKPCPPPPCIMGPGTPGTPPTPGT